MEGNNYRSAEDPFSTDGKNYHLAIRSDQVAPIVLLPGDPDRVSLISRGWDSWQEVGRNREFVSHTGTIGGTPVSAISTGIGNPAMATVVESLTRMDVHTLLRVGTTGGIQPWIECGDLIIATGAVRLDGASKAYVRPEYPAVAHHEVLLALVQACEDLGYRYHLGVTASTDSWYLGQGRPGAGGYVPSFAAHLMSDLQMAGVLNFEMESAALLTLAGVYRLRAGAIFSVVANRVTNRLDPEGIERSVAAGNRAVQILARLDRQKQQASKEHWFPGIGL